MPPILVYEDPDGILEISDGVTRATRIAKLAPGQTVPIVVIGGIDGAGRLPMREGSVVSQRATPGRTCSPPSRSCPRSSPRCGRPAHGRGRGNCAADLHGRGLWDAEDDGMLEAVWRFRRNYEAAVTPSDDAGNGGIVQDS